MPRQIPFHTFTQDLNVAPLDVSFLFTQDAYLDQIIINLGAEITETITVTHVAKEGSAFNVNLDLSTLSTEDDYVFRPTGRCPFKKGDSIRIQCTAATATSVASGKVHFSTADGRS